jgi:catechol 2,3-dioxygenase-like lactoylglutathione lyase family enzyme
MPASGRLTGFVPTKDYDRARAFYEGKLGFELVSLDQYALVVSVGGHKIRIAKVPTSRPARYDSRLGGRRHSLRRKLAGEPRCRAGEVSLR